MTDIEDQWCGQTQPHDAHTWVSSEGLLEFEEQCGGHKG
jgi:hypothetical protein